MEEQKFNVGDEVIIDPYSEKGCSPDDDGTYCIDCMESPMYVTEVICNSTGEYEYKVTDNDNNCCTFCYYDLMLKKSKTIDNWKKEMEE